MDALLVAKAYNSWLHDIFLKADPRLKGVAILPIQNPAEAVKELWRCVRKLGMIGGLMPAGLRRKIYGTTRKGFMESNFAGGEQT